jgi:hypothetical protein
MQWYVCVPDGPAVVFIAQERDTRNSKNNKTQSSVAILQIGAHTGWTENDPLVKGTTSYSEQLSTEARSRVSFVYVEASPPTFVRLEKNLEEHSDRFNLSALLMGVLPDDTEDMNLTFYSISESVNRETGLDSRTGKSVPKIVSEGATSQAPRLFKEETNSSGYQ